MKKRNRPAALITGGSRRLGRALALALARDGFDIALHYNHSSVDAVKAAVLIKKCGVDCDIFQADLLDPADTVGILPGVLKKFPRLQILVNSASLFLQSGLGTEDIDLLSKHWGIHVQAPWVLSSEFAKVVKQGVIVNFLDTRIVKNKTDSGAYLLSKKALAELTKMQAVRFAPDIRVNAVAPGLILAPEGKGPDYLKKRAAAVPLKRPGTIANIVQTVRFLIANDYVTGQTVFVDGGEHLV